MSYIIKPGILTKPGYIAFILLLDSKKTMIRIFLNLFSRNNFPSLYI